MTAKRAEVPGGRATMYARQLAISAPRERVFDAVGTLDGPRHWWTTIVTGSAAPGGELCFGFNTAKHWWCGPHWAGPLASGQLVTYNLLYVNSLAVEEDSQ